MKIKVNDDNIITCYACTGDVDGSIEINKKILPKDFKEKFKKGLYVYDKDNKEIKENEDYEKPKYPEYENFNEDKTKHEDMQKKIDDLEKAIDEIKDNQTSDDE